jgi:uncharacterized protein
MELSITPERMAAYKRGARERLAREEAATQERRAAAWQVARHAAARLRDEFGARRVLVFGSLVAGARFSATSDVDLAVEGIAPDRFWSAWASLDYIESPFEIDLVAIEFAPPKLCTAIESEGVEV